MLSHFVVFKNLATKQGIMRVGVCVGGGGGESGGDFKGMKQEMRHMRQFLVYVYPQGWKISFS